MVNLDLVSMTRLGSISKNYEMDYYRTIIGLLKAVSAIVCYCRFIVLTAILLFMLFTASNSNSNVKRT